MVAQAPAIAEGDMVLPTKIGLKVSRMGKEKKGEEEMEESTLTFPSTSTRQLIKIVMFYYITYPT